MNLLEWAKKFQSPCILDGSMMKRSMPLKKWCGSLHSSSEKTRQRPEKPSFHRRIQYNHGRLLCYYEF